MTCGCSSSGPRRRPRGARGDPTAHRAVPLLARGAKVWRRPTVDRRLSTVCGFYRFAHIDGHVVGEPGPVRAPTPGPPVRTDGAWTAPSSRRFLFTAERYDHDHAALAVLLGLNGLRVSEACATNIEDLGFERGHRTLGILGKGNKPAVIPLVPRTARTIDLAVGERCRGPDPAPPRRATPRPAHRAPLGSIDRQSRRDRDGASAHAARRVHHGRPRRRCPTSRRADRRPPRGPANDHDLRPAPPELRPPRRLRRRGVCHGRITGGRFRHRSAPWG